MEEVCSAEGTGDDWWGSALGGIDIHWLEQQGQLLRFKSLLGKPTIVANMAEDLIVTKFA